MVITTPFNYGSLAQEFEKVFQTSTTTSYPPYNVIYYKDNQQWTLEFAVAGFTKEDISVTTQNGILDIKAEKPDVKLHKEGEYLHKGIAARKFARSFTLPEYAEVFSASVKDGILAIDLLRNIPEEKKPKQITIS